LRCCVHKAHIISGDEREVVNVVESAVGITAFGEWYVGEVSRSGKREVERVGVPRWVDTYLNGGVGIGGQVVGVTGWMRGSAWLKDASNTTIVWDELELGDDRDVLRAEKEKVEETRDGHFADEPIA
jgi:hypothetical protein